MRGQAKVGIAMPASQAPTTFDWQEPDSEAMEVLRELEGGGEAPQAPAVFIPLADTQFMNSLGEI